MASQVLSTGVDLYYEVHGDGEPLLLLPGTGLGCNVWKKTQIPTLAQSLKVIALDPRGCGRSQAPDDVWTIEQMGCDAVALLDHLGIESAHVVGHSMGGRMGIAMALDFPGRVRSLVLAASGSGPAARSGEECVPGLPYRLVNELVQMGFEEFVRDEICDTTTYFTKEFLDSSPDRVKDFYNIVWAQHARWPQFLRLVMARHTFEATHRLGGIRAPTLIAIGDDDVVGSNHVLQAKAMAARIPGAEVFTIKGQSHGFFWQDPEATNAWILDWIRRNKR